MVLVVILQPMDQLFHLLRQRIVTSREDTLEPTLIDGPYRVAAVVVVSAHSFHNELSQLDTHSFPEIEFHWSGTIGSGTANPGSGAASSLHIPCDTGRGAAIPERRD